MGSLRRMPSGNLYEGFPCVRVGDYLLPSSMDLRAPPAPATLCCADPAHYPITNRAPVSNCIAQQVTLRTWAICTWHVDVLQAWQTACT